MACGYCILSFFFGFSIHIDEGGEKLYLMVTTRKRKKKLGKRLYKICTSDSLC
jgi:hypothetical protein